MKIYAPKYFAPGSLKIMMRQMFASPETLGKFLEVHPRSVHRWLAEDSAPRPVLVACWYESGPGREAAMIDAGNLLVLTRADVQIKAKALDLGAVQLAYILAISDTGASNDPLMMLPPALEKATLPRGPARWCRPALFRGC